ncbi:MAG: HEAT repeat domain-containing protein [Planctomycetes bacterium]|nr:HEAT repeat domain-containing protein [Planctomycetota bacterium]
MHEDDFEVQFCDLCGTSVPMADLESGAAVRHQAKTIGACCLTVLRRGDSPLVTAAPSTGEPAHAVAVGAGGPAPRGRGDGLLLPVAIALLAGMAGVAIYLDLQIQSLADRQVRDQQTLATGLASSTESLRTLDQAMDGVARKSDLDGLRETVSGFEGKLELAAEEQRQGGEKLRRGLDGVQQEVAQLTKQKVDYRPMFDDLRQQVVRTQRAIAELQVAAPAAEATGPAPAALPVAEPVAAVTDPGLPPELAAQVQRLADPDAAVRFEAVDHLLVSKNVAVLPHLLPMTKDADGFVRRLAVEGLRDFRHPDAVEALLEALADGDPNVSDTAWSSLKRLTNQKIPFDAASPSKDARLRQQQRWREWWDKNKAAFDS